MFHSPFVKEHDVQKNFKSLRHLLIIDLILSLIFELTEILTDLLGSMILDPGQCRKYSAAVSLYEKIGQNIHISSHIIGKLLL